MATGKMLVAFHFAVKAGYGLRLIFFMLKIGLFPNLFLTLLNRANLDFHFLKIIQLKYKITKE